MMISHLTLAIVLGIVTAPAVLSVNRCNGRFPSGIRVVGYHGVCYAFVKEPRLAYDAAEKYCEEHGDYLVVIKNNAVSKFIQKKVKSFHTKAKFWIGLNDKRVEDVYEWEDGTPMTDFHRFHHGQGILSKKYHHYRDCVAVDSKGHWFDYNCGKAFPAISTRSKHPFICQFKKNSPRVSSTVVPRATTHSPVSEITSESVTAHTSATDRATENTSEHPHTSATHQDTENTSEQPQTSENTSEQPQTSENTSEQPQTSVNTSEQPQTSENTSEQPQTSENTSEQPQTSENTSEQPQTSATHQDAETTSEQVLVHTTLSQASSEPEADTTQTIAIP